MTNKVSLKKATVRQSVAMVRMSKYVKKILKLSLSPLFTSKVLFNFALKHAIKRLQLGKCMFALPSILSTIHFSKKLEVMVPLVMLEQELDDWVEVDSKVMHIHRYFIVQGDLSPITRSSKFLKLDKEIRGLKEVSWDYKKTEKYKSIRNKMAQNTPPVLHQQVIDTEEKVEGYFARISQLYHSISLNGLLHVSELDNRVKKSFPIYVGIGAAGHFFKLPSGKHRLAIAKMLNIKNVPVVINMIHYDWIKRQALEKGVSEYEAVCIILDDCKNLT